MNRLRLLAIGVRLSLLGVAYPGLVGIGSSHPAPRATSTRVATPAPAPPPLRFELANGLRVWVQEDHTRPVALVQVAYKVGAINESPGTTGTAHYVEHMVYRATEHIRNEDIYGYIDRIGGRYTGGTDQLETSYGETVPVWAFEAALRTTAERMGHTLFDSTEFERERNNVVTEANGFARSDPLNALRDAVMLTSFELHPYRYTSDTWAQDNLAITRNVAYDFYRRFYGPNNAVLAIVGDVTIDVVRPLVEKYFGPLARSPESGEIKIIEPPQRVEKRVTLSAPVERKQLEVVYRAPAAAHRDYPILVALDRVLAARLARAIPPSTGTVMTSHSATPYPFVYRLSVSASASTDLDQLLSTIQFEIARLGSEPVSAAELTIAHTEPAARGGRGRGGAAGGGETGVPPRQSNLTQIATELTEQEAFPWVVSAQIRDRVRLTAASVTAPELQGYVDRWLRRSQRTVGMLVPGAADFMPVWSNGRPLAGDRLEVPPLTTPPARRLRPEPVPPRSLEPLAPPPIATARRQLANGVVVRAARNDAPTAALHVRVRFGVAADPPEREGLSLLVARLIAADSGLAALRARPVTTTVSNDGYFDVRLGFPAESLSSVIATVVRALRVRSIPADQISGMRAPSPGPPMGRAGGGGGGGRGSPVNANARARVLATVAPAWRPPDYGTHASLGRIGERDVGRFLSQRLTGGAVTVSIVAPRDPADLLALAAQPFATLPSGRRVVEAAMRDATASRHATAPLPEQRVPLASETQVTVLAGLPGVPRGHPDSRALELLNYIVGVPSYGGRLGWALTKAGLTYSSAATTTFGASTGHILMSTKCDTRNLDATIQAIREVIAGVAERGVEDWEVREAQAFTLGRTLLYGPRDDSGEEAIATALLDAELSGLGQLDLPAFSRAYLAVTPQEINAVARRYYRPERLAVVAIGAMPAAQSPPLFPAGTFRALFEP